PDRPAVQVLEQAGCLERRGLQLGGEVVEAIGSVGRHHVDAVVAEVAVLQLVNRVVEADLVAAPGLREVASDGGCRSTRTRGGVKALALGASARGQRGGTAVDRARVG